MSRVDAQPRHVLALAALLALGLGGRASAQSPVHDGSGQRVLPHLRVGLELGGGVGYGASTAAVLGLYGQLGYQLNRTVAFFYQPGLLAYGFRSRDDVDAFGIFSNALMVDLTAGDVAQVGVGGGFDVSDFARCREGACTYDGRGVYPSLELRVAFLLRVRRARARWYVPFSLHAHIAFGGGDSVSRQNRQTMLLLTLGLERAGMRLRR